MGICCILQSGRMSICRRLHIGDIPMWVEMGLAIGAGIVAGTHYSVHGLNPSPGSIHGHMWKLAHAKKGVWAHSGACNGWAPDGSVQAKQEMRQVVNT